VTIVEHVSQDAVRQARAATIEARFQEFHAAHPEVYVKLVQLANDLVDRGWSHLGIGMLWETLRYYTMLGSHPDEDVFRLNDHYRSRYARMIMEQERRLEGIFEIRELRAP
jgi:hypothetical protein